MVSSRIFESDLYLTNVLFSSSCATYIRKFKGRELHNLVVLSLKLHEGDSFMGCTFRKIRLLRGIINRALMEVIMRKVVNHVS